MRIALYCRVSKSDNSQDPTNQLIPLRKFAEAIGGEVVAEYVDLRSGAKSDRVNFLKMLSDADSHRWDLLLIWSLDRLSREGISNTLAYLQRLKKNGVSVKSLQESWLDTRDTGVGELLLAIFSWVAQQERNRIRERIMAGLYRAKASGKRLGRPFGSKDKKRRRTSGYVMRWNANK